MKTILLSTLFLLSISLPAVAQITGTSELCGKIFDDQISFSRNVQTRASSEFTLVTWNAHKMADTAYLPDLRELSRNADLMLVQEAMHTGTLQESLSSAFDFSFGFSKSWCSKEKQATGVMNLSRYNLENSLTLVSPDTEPFLNTPKVSEYSMINVPEMGLIHVINTHALNFNLGGKFERHIDQIAEFISKINGRVIWAGDFNTWNSARTNYLLSKAKALGLLHIVPADDKRSLKLDHVFVKGLKVTESKILNNFSSSDHLPLKVIFEKAN